MSSTSLLNTKCSVCGAELVFPAGQDVVLCEYCLRPNDRPKSEANETSLMKYANERRNMGEFDAAEESYRRVLQKNIGEHEARWGVLLCKYGVMYVEDGRSGKRLITCRKAVSSAMSAESDFRICCEQASASVRDAYKRDAAYVDAVQAQIRRIRSEEEPYDVFICYKETASNGERTKDSQLAENVCKHLEAQGYRVFYARETLKIKGGANYEAAIFAALSDARVMLALGTRLDYFESTWVSSEWKRFLKLIEKGEKKELLPLFMDLRPDIDLPMEFRALRLQAVDMADGDFLKNLSTRLEELIPEKSSKRRDEEQRLWNVRFKVEDGDFEEAVQDLNALRMAMPECSAVHLMLCMAKAKAHNEAELIELTSPLSKNNHIKRALEFADADSRAHLEEIIRKQAERLKAKAEAKAKVVPAPLPENEMPKPGTASLGGSKPLGEGGSKEEAATGTEEQPRETFSEEDFALLLKRAGQQDAEAIYKLGVVFEEGKGKPVDKKLAFMWYRKAVQLDHPEAQYRLGQMYRRGDGAAHDMAEAVRLLRLSADRNCPPALFALGSMQYEGDGMRQDTREGLRLCTLAAEAGCAEARYWLGCLYQEGKGVPQDFAEAVRWFRQAVEDGNEQAHLRLGLILRRGDEVDRDDNEAFRLLLFAAGRGEREAQYEVGTMYYRGEGTSKNLSEAARWYGEAAKRDHPMAQYRLGCLYYVGEGVKQNYSQAFKWFRKAADQGVAAAKCRIGDMYYHGLGMKENKAQAMRCYLESGRDGYAPALYNVGNMYYAGIGVLKDRTGAVRWYREAAKGRYAQAQFVLAEILFKGSGVPQRVDEALKWYREAADQRYSRAQYALAVLYHTGDCVPADQERAYELCLAAAEQHLAVAQNSVANMLWKGEGVEMNRAEAIRWFQEADRNGSKDAQSFLRTHAVEVRQAEQRAGRRKTEAGRTDEGRRRVVQDGGDTEAEAPRGGTTDSGSSPSHAAPAGEIQDSWEQIVAAARDGSARSRYVVNSWKTLSAGALGQLALQLVGFELDERADGRGRAATTWIARQLLPEPQRMNNALYPVNPLYKKGTGAVGGWQNSALRAYLSTVVLPQLPESVREGITQVVKRQASYNASGYGMQQRTVDGLWIPSEAEVCGGQAAYGALLAADGMATPRASAWWLRSASGVDRFNCVAEDGEEGECRAELALGVVIGFCL